MDKNLKEKKQYNWQVAVYNIIFKDGTTSHKCFDISLIVIIILSVITVMISSIESFYQKYSTLLFWIEWFFTILFTIEYTLRIVCSRKALSYAFSFFGFVDFFAIVPTYISLLIPGSHILVVIRILRVLRVFRVLKLVQYIGESDLLVDALISSRRKITVFLFSVFTIVIIFGSIMYTVEHHENGFSSIPRSIYWAIVTLTTVGYGDITPKTNFGQALSSIIMIMGYGILAVPTGIVTAEIATAMGHHKGSARICNGCDSKWHDDDAIYCKHCSAKL